MSKLTYRRNVQLVRLPILLKYIEFARTKTRKYNDTNSFLKELEEDIKTIGLKQPLILSVCKDIQKPYLSERNHGTICLDNLGVH